MSLLINYHKFDIGIALKDENHPLHMYAVEYTKGINELKQRFPQKVIKFVRPGFPKVTKGMDSAGKDTMMVEPATPVLFPLERKYVNSQGVEDVWSCCLEMPKLNPNGLYSIGNKKSIKVDEFLNVNLDKQPDLAFYLYYISKFGTRDNDGRLKVDDPQKDIREKADKKKRDVERQTAIWQMLTDEIVLRKIAAAYDVPNTGTKNPDTIRFDLEKQLEINDKKKINDFTVKGTKEFLEEMKVTDSVRLRAFLKKLDDDKKFDCKADGRLRLGDKLITQIPYDRINDKMGFIWDYYQTNREKLEELMRDVVTKEFLDSLDPKDISWVAKVMNIQISFKKADEIRALVYGAFSIAL